MQPPDLNYMRPASASRKEELTVTWGGATLNRISGYDTVWNFASLRGVF
jgi:hypothetical protein